MNSNRKLILTSIFTAVASSLCCITPVLALLAGSSGMASTFLWLEPARPYLIGFTILVLIYAWWQKLKHKKEVDCDCEEDEKQSFMQTKTFLGIVTVFAVVMTAFPYFSGVFYPDSKQETIVVDANNSQKVEVKIDGMTCDACQNHIDYAVKELPGIIRVSSSYDKGSSSIDFDKTKTTIEEIQEAINSTGYTVINIELK